MRFADCFRTRESLLLEGALGERLKREYYLQFDGHVVMAALVYSAAGRAALEALWTAAPPSPANTACYF